MKTKVSIYLVEEDTKDWVRIKETCTPLCGFLSGKETAEELAFNARQVMKAVDKELLDKIKRVVVSFAYKAQMYCGILDIKDNKVFESIKLGLFSVHSTLKGLEEKGRDN